MLDSSSPSWSYWPGRRRRCRQRRRPISLLFHVLLVCVVLPMADALDVFCGQLEVFEEQRFGNGAVTLSSQTTSDLKQCLDICCSIPNCRGVTFEGIVSEADEANCLLVGCRDECQLNQPRRFSDGVVSVVIKRKPGQGANTTEAMSTASTVASAGSTLSSSNVLIGVRSRWTPVWVLAVAISVAVVCIGLNVTLCLAYCCYCRRKRRSQKAHISTAKGGPTLHAYNQNI